MAVILVVDDEFGIANLLDDVLSDEGHQVRMASNGKQALDLARTETPDLVLTDYMMPVMNGAALAEALAQDESLKHVPVAMMSSLPASSIAERCPTCVLFLRKPFKLIELVDAVNGILEG